MARGFEKFFMGGACSRCHSFTTKVYYFYTFSTNMNLSDEKFRKENQIIKVVWILPHFIIELELLLM